MQGPGRLIATGLTLVWISASAAGAPADPQLLRTRSLAATCNACHPTTSFSGSPARLAGRPAATLIAQMKAFKSGARAGTVMPQLAQGFSDLQIDQLADWFMASTPDAH